MVAEEKPIVKIFPTKDLKVARSNSYWDASNITTEVNFLYGRNQPFAMVEVTVKKAYFNSVDLFWKIEEYNPHPPTDYTYNILLPVIKDGETEIYVEAYGQAYDMYVERHESTDDFITLICYSKAYKLACSLSFDSLIKIACIETDTVKFYIVGKQPIEYLPSKLMPHFKDRYEVTYNFGGKLDPTAQVRFVIDYIKEKGSRTSGKARINYIEGTGTNLFKFIAVYALGFKFEDCLCDAGFSYDYSLLYDKKTITEADLIEIKPVGYLSTPEPLKERQYLNIKIGPAGYKIQENKDSSLPGNIVIEDDGGFSYLRGTVLGRGGTFKFNVIQKTGPSNLKKYKFEVVDGIPTEFTQEQSALLRDSPKIIDANETLRLRMNLVNCWSVIKVIGYMTNRWPFFYDRAYFVDYNTESKYSSCASYTYMKLGYGAGESYFEDLDGGRQDIALCKIIDNKDQGSAYVQSKQTVHAENYSVSAEIVDTAKKEEGADIYFPYPEISTYDLSRVNNYSRNYFAKKIAFNKLVTCSTPYDCIQFSVSEVIKFDDDGIYDKYATSLDDLYAIPDLADGDIGLVSYGFIETYYRYNGTTKEWVPLDHAAKPNTRQARFPLYAQFDKIDDTQNALYLKNVPLACMELSWPACITIFTFGNPKFTDLESNISNLIGNAQESLNKGTENTVLSDKEAPKIVVGNQTLSNLDDNRFGFTGMIMEKNQDSALYRFAGYKDGKIQAQFNTEGKMVAGGGSVVLDENGLSTFDLSSPEKYLQASVGTDGKIVAGGGSIVLDKSGAKFYDTPQRGALEAMIDTQGRFNTGYSGNVPHVYLDGTGLNIIKSSSYKSYAALNFRDYLGSETWTANIFCDSNTKNLVLRAYGDYGIHMYCDAGSVPRTENLGNYTRTSAIETGFSVANWKTLENGEILDFLNGADCTYYTVYDTSMPFSNLITGSSLDINMPSYLPYNSVIEFSVTAEKDSIYKITIKGESGKEYICSNQDDKGEGTKVYSIKNAGEFLRIVNISEDHWTPVESKVTKYKTIIHPMKIKYVSEGGASSSIRLTSAGALIDAGSTNVTGDFAVGGNISLNGGLNTSTLNVTGQATVGGGLTVAGDTSLKNIVATGDSSFNGNVAILGNTNIKNSLTLSDSAKSTIQSLIPIYIPNAAYLNYGGGSEYSGYFIINAFIKENVDRIAVCMGYNNSPSAVTTEVSFPVNLGAILYAACSTIRSNSSDKGNDYVSSITSTGMVCKHESGGGFYWLAIGTI